MKKYIAFLYLFILVPLSGQSRITVLKTGERTPIPNATITCKGIILAKTNAEGIAHFKTKCKKVDVKAVGFYEDDRRAYFPGRMDNDKIFGSVTVFRLNKNNEPKLNKFLRGPWSIRFNSAPIKNMLFLTSFAVLAEGDYVVVYDIYVLKSIPFDLNNIVMVSEKVTWK